MPAALPILRSAKQMLDWSRRERAAGRSIGFVPTMGALHRGHLSLVQRARRENDRVVASIFVNPIQFAPGEDFESYPRDLAADRAVLRASRCDVAFVPARASLFPHGFQTVVTVPGLSAPLCGRFRPGHFEGVATIVAKLLHIVEPDRLYLGQKDYQQSLVISRMIRDLDLPVRLVTAPTVREEDGLAMSSRNRYLSPEDRRRAAGIQRALQAGARAVRRGLTSPARVRALVRAALKGIGRVQYVEVLDARDLTAPRRLQGPTVLAAAVFVGRARLIDNVVVKA